MKAVPSSYSDRVTIAVLRTRRVRIMTGMRNKGEGGESSTILSFSSGNNFYMYRINKKINRSRLRNGYNDRYGSKVSKEDVGYQS